MSKIELIFLKNIKVKIKLLSKERILINYLNLSLASHFKLEFFKDKLYYFP